jgi:hypothetical protein
VISAATREKWDRQLAFLMEHQEEARLTQWESDRVDEWSIRREYGKDLTMGQAIKLSEIYRKAQERIG